MSKQKQIEVVESTDSKELTEHVNRLLASGFQIIASDCKYSHIPSTGIDSPELMASFVLVLVQHESEEDVRFRDAKAIESIEEPKAENNEVGPLDPWLTNC